MACELTAGFTLQCKDGIGGIKSIYLVTLGNFNDGGVVSIDGTSQEVEGLPTCAVYEYTLPKHTGMFTEEVASNVENGTIFYTQTVTATFHKLSAPRRKQLELIAKNRLVVFVLDNNNNIWLVGKVDGAEVTAASTATGTAKGDLNGYTLTLTAEEANKAYRLESFQDIPFDNFNGISVIAPTI